MEAAKPDLGRTLTTVLDLDAAQGERLPLPVKAALTEKNCAIRSIAGSHAPRPTRWSRKSVRSSNGPPGFTMQWVDEALAQVERSFDAACDRWRGLYPRRRRPARAAPRHHRRPFPAGGRAQPFPKAACAGRKPDSAPHRGRRRLRRRLLLVPVLRDGRVPARLQLSPAPDLRLRAGPARAHRARRIHLPPPLSRHLGVRSPRPDLPRGRALSGVQGQSRFRLRSDRGHAPSRDGDDQALLALRIRPPRSRRSQPFRDVRRLRGRTRYLIPHRRPGAVAERELEARAAHHVRRRGTAALRLQPRHRLSIPRGQRQARSQGCGGAMRRRARAHARLRRRDRPVARQPRLDAPGRAASRAASTSTSNAATGRATRPTPPIATTRWRKGASCGWCRS